MGKRNKTKRIVSANHLACSLPRKYWLCCSAIPDQVISSKDLGWMMYRHVNMPWTSKYRQSKNKGTA